MDKAEPNGHSSVCVSRAHSSGYGRGIFRFRWFGWTESAAQRLEESQARDRVEPSHCWHRSIQRLAPLQRGAGPCRADSGALVLLVIRDVQFQSFQWLMSWEKSLCKRKAFLLFSFLFLFSLSSPPFSSPHCVVGF